MSEAIEKQIKNIEKILKSDVASKNEFKRELKEIVRTSKALNVTVRALVKDNLQLTSAIQQMQQLVTSDATIEALLFYSKEENHESGLFSKSKIELDRGSKAQVALKKRGALSKTDSSK